LQKLLEINEKIGSFVASVPEDSLHKINCYMGNPGLRSSIDQILIFLGCISAVGAVITVSAFLSISAAYNAASAVRLLFVTHREPGEIEVVDKLNRNRKRQILVYKFLENNHMFPLLTGGGHGSAEIIGHTAAWSIPAILLAGWVISGYVLWGEYKTVTKLFSKAWPCSTFNIQTTAVPIVNISGWWPKP
jgi:hypothetical protein